MDRRESERYANRGVGREKGKKKKGESHVYFYFILLA